MENMRPDDDCSHDRKTTSTRTSSTQTTTTTTTTTTSPSLLDEMNESMAYSMLIFLVADLRLMSATGRIATPYEYMAVESDLRVRATAADMAGIGHVVQRPNISAATTTAAASTTNHGQRQNNKELSPAQCMALVLIEMRRSFEQVNNNNNNNKNGNDTDNDDMNHTTTQHDDDGTGTFTDFIRSVKRRRIDKSQQPSRRRPTQQQQPPNGMHKLLKAYADMLGHDLLERVPYIEARQSMLHLVDNNSSNNNNNKHQPSCMKRNPTLNPVPEHVTDAMFNMAIRHDEVAAETSLLQGVGGGGQARPSLASANNKNKDTTFLTGAQLLTILEKATQTRDASKLDVMGKFFRNGTISHIMVQSHARFIWVNDFYPLKDLTYAIGIDRDKKRVLVVFRGAITRQDWATVTYVHQTRVKNPIAEDFVNKPAKVNLHTGFYRYLFRVRQDTGTTKFDEICNVAHKYGVEQIGQDNYTMAVIGHSLGGALTTVFTFFASADPRFVANGPIKAFSFGSPYVGGHDFADSWRYQEQKGRIMYARFYNHNDTVAYVPLNFSVTSRGALYRHVGVGIKIPRVPRCFTQCRKWKPRVHYVGNDGCVRAYRRAWGRNVLFNSPFPTQIPHMHCLAELQERMRDGMFRKEGDRGDYEVLHKPIEDIYKELVGVDLERVRPDICR
eukprot:scaffold5126_cov190-Amphora_coffeaeformis.AAC.1